MNDCLAGSSRFRGVSCPSPIDEYRGTPDVRRAVARLGIADLPPQGDYGERAEARHATAAPWRCRHGQKDLVSGSSARPSNPSASRGCHFDRSENSRCCRTLMLDLAVELSVCVPCRAKTSSALTTSLLCRVPGHPGSSESSFWRRSHPDLRAEVSGCRRPGMAGA